MVLKTSFTLLALIISGQAISQENQSTTNPIQAKSNEKDIERIIVTGSRIAENID